MADMTPIERKARELLAAEVRHSDFYVERDAVLRAIAAALRSAQVPEWQPIETAPRDELILIADDRRCVFVAAWNGGDPKWKWAIADIACLTLGDEPDGMPENRPTHWMPLPAAPSPKGDEP